MKVRAKVDLFYGGMRRRAGTVFEIEGSPSKHMEALGAAPSASDPAKKPKKPAATMSEINAETADAEKQAMTGKVAE